MAFIAFSLLMAANALPAMPTVDTPVLVRAVEKGEMLALSDFTDAALPSATARGAVRPSDANGREAIRRLPAGAIVRANDIAAPRLVRRGAAVTITLVSGPLRITAPGRALSDGAAGDAVRVINLSTNKTLEAIADTSGEVRVLAR